MIVAREDTSNTKDDSEVPAQATGIIMMTVTFGHIEQGIQMETSRKLLEM